MSDESLLLIRHWGKEILTWTYDGSSGLESLYERVSEFVGCLLNDERTGPRFASLASQPFEILPPEEVRRLGRAFDEGKRAFGEALGILNEQVPEIVKGAWEHKPRSCFTQQAYAEASRDFVGVLTSGPAYSSARFDLAGVVLVGVCYRSLVWEKDQGNPWVWAWEHADWIREPCHITHSAGFWLERELRSLREIALALGGELGKAGEVTANHRATCKMLDPAVEAGRRLVQLLRNASFEAERTWAQDALRLALVYMDWAPGARRVGSVWMSGALRAFEDVSTKALEHDMTAADSNSIGDALTRVLQEGVRRMLQRVASWTGEADSMADLSRGPKDAEVGVNGRCDIGESTNKEEVRLEGNRSEQVAPDHARGAEEFVAAKLEGAQEESASRRLRAAGAADGAVPAVVGRWREALHEAVEVGFGGPPESRTRDARQERVGQWLEREAFTGLTKRLLVECEARGLDSSPIRGLFGFLAFLADFSWRGSVESVEARRAAFAQECQRFRELRRAADVVVGRLEAQGGAGGGGKAAGKGGTASHGKVDATAVHFRLRKSTEEVWVDGVPLTLKGRPQYAFCFLLALCERPNETAEHEDILRLIGGDATKEIEIQQARRVLRDALKDIGRKEVFQQIETRRKHGYRLKTTTPPTVED